jgi:arylsulfatase A-like enzyme
MIIFPDQFRQYSLGFWSQPGNAQHLQGNPDPVVTPALDKLANQSVVFSRSVSNYPLCSPYRGMLLSGMYPSKNGLTTNCRSDRDVGLNVDAQCITDVYAQAGYNVSYFGKCHWQRTEPLFDEQGTYVGTTDAPGGKYINRYDTYVPPGRSRHNIDYFFQALKDDHFNPMIYSSDPIANDGKKEGELNMPGVFSSKLESEVIIDYLSNTHGQRDPNKPFLLIWSLNPPHNPWTEESTYMDFYEQYTYDGEVMLDNLLTHANVDSTVGHYAAYYFANVSAVDYFIGKVLDHLEMLDLADNTIIVFSSDHGEMLGSHGLQGKNVPEIEAFSIPLMIKWGDWIKPHVEDLIVSVPDIMPTVLGLSGMADLIPGEVQGKNYSSLLTRPDSDLVEEPEAALFLNLHARGVYTGKYMFVVEEKGNVFSQAFLYDNEADPDQMNRISLDQIDKNLLTSLKSELYSLLTETEDNWITEGICRDFFQSN